MILTRRSIINIWRINCDLFTISLYKCQIHIWKAVYLWNELFKTYVTIQRVNNELIQWTIYCSSDRQDEHRTPYISTIKSKRKPTKNKAYSTKCNLSTNSPSNFIHSHFDEFKIQKGLKKEKHQEILLLCTRNWRWTFQYPIIHHLLGNIQ